MNENVLREVSERVHSLYWVEDRNCAYTTLKVIPALFGVSIDPQVMDAVTGMHGAGKFGAQCGLVEGSLLFIGIWGKERNLSDGEIEKICYTYAGKFQQEFGSLLCRVLRPKGFSPKNPPHLCEDLTVKSIIFVFEYISDLNQ